MILMDLTPEEKALIDRHRAEQERRKSMEWTPRLASEYSTEEKCNEFDKLHALALNEFNTLKVRGYMDDDHKQWCFEGVTELLGAGVWPVWNSLNR